MGCSEYQEDELQEQKGSVGKENMKTNMSKGGVGHSRNA